MTHTTAGMPYSRATTDPWVINPPISITRPPAIMNSGVHAGSVWGATRISPGRRVCALGSVMTRANPSTDPADAPLPGSASVGRSCCESCVVITSPSLVITRGGRTFAARFNAWRRVATASGGSPVSSPRSASNSSNDSKKTSSTRSRRPFFTSVRPAVRTTSRVRAMIHTSRNFGFSRTPRQPPFRWLCPEPHGEDARPAPGLFGPGLPGLRARDSSRS